LGGTDLSGQALVESDPLARHALSPRELKELIATEQRGEPFLAYRDEEGCLRLFTMSEGHTSMVGRRCEMELSIPWDFEVSGFHAELRCTGGECTIVDDGLSTNGTYVNGKRLSGRQRLRPGDRIRVGATWLAFVRPAAITVGETTRTADRPVVHLTDMQRRVLIALCRPYRDGSRFAAPATNQHIAAEVFLGVDAVKVHLRNLFGRFGLADLPQNEKRRRLAESALQSGLIDAHELD
jgi:hypothetical protein